MAQRRSPVEVVEAAYDVVADDKRWLTGILQAVQPELDRGYGVGGILFDASDPANLRICGASDTNMPNGLSEALLACTQAANADLLKPLFFGGPIASFSAVLGPEALQQPLAHDRLVTAFGVRDMIGLIATDPTGSGCAINACAPRPTKLSPSFIGTWSRIASHIAAGFRLRRAAPAGESDVAAGAEAVLSPTGKAVHAEAPASSPQAREALREAAVAVDRARRLAKRDPEEAIALWRALVAGRWSLVDRFDNDGRRFLVVKRNDPEPAGRPARALTLRERQIVGYAALGHSNKLIAYELGLSQSTVANRLKSAAEKLGCRTRIELVRAVARTMG